MGVSMKVLYRRLIRQLADFEIPASFWPQTLRHLTLIIVPVLYKVFTKK
jgi:hypothetical protein